MRSSRTALCALTVGAMALPIVGLAYDRVEPPVERTKLYELSSYVVEGQVKSVHRIDREGKRASSGPRFALDLTVKAVRKSKEKDKLAKGNIVSVRGWVEGKQKQTYLPVEKDEVMAFLNRKNGVYEPVGKTGFKLITGRRASPAPAPPSKK